MTPEAKVAKNMQLAALGNNTAEPHDYAETATRLINSGADVDVTKDEAGYTAAMLCAENGLVNTLLPLIIEHKADLSKKCSDERKVDMSCLGLAARNNHGLAIRLLVEKGKMDKDEVTL